jgi:predicted permease
MNWLRATWTRLRNLFHKEQLDHNLHQELAAHLEMHIEDNLRSGMSREEARRKALLSLGGVEQTKESVRDQRGFPFLESLLQDVRYGLRRLRRSPGFTTVAVVTLALGIGATTAVFSIVDAVLLHGTPYQNPSRIVEIAARSLEGEARWVSWLEFRDWQAQTKPQVFDDLGAYVRWEYLVLTGLGEPDEVYASKVSTNVFQLLGVNAAIGRTFTDNDTQAVILSHDYWHNHFAADPKIIGKTFALDGKPYSVIGVASADLEFPDPNTQVWIPLVLSAAEESNRKHRAIEVIARLKAGVILKQAQAAMDLVARRLATQYPDTNAGITASVQLNKSGEIGDVLRSSIFALIGAVVFVLLIVCSNVTSMLLARGTTRQGEMAIRAALGSGRMRLIRQLVVEAILLAGAASVMGLVLASSGLALILNLLPKQGLIETVALHRISINLPVLGFTIALSLLTAIAVSLLPALRASKLSLNESLKQRGRSSGSGARRSRPQRALIVAEVAMALVLLVGAGLMIQSFKRLQSVPTGFHPDHLLTVRVPLVNYKYEQGLQSAAFYRTVLERIQAIPGVQSAAMVNNLPFTSFWTTVDFPAPPNSPVASGKTFFVANRDVSPGYFQAMGIPLIEGRDFIQTDNQQDAPCVRIVNETMVRSYWSGKDPVGTQVRDACAKDAPALIVGVVADSKQHSVDSPPEPEVYTPYGQHPFASFLITFVIRTASNPMQVATAVRHAVSEIDHDQPVIEIRTMKNVVSESIWRQQLSASMLGMFAGIALLLSAVGIYGVFSYSVGQRTHEIGIRTALGATRGDILRMVLREGLLLTIIGLGVGILAALWLTRLLASLLYGVVPRDPLTFVALSLLLTAVALLACYIPARRATRVDPVIALRYE